MILPISILRWLIFSPFGVIQRTSTHARSMCFRVVRPRLHENLAILAALDTSKLIIETRKLSDLKRGFIRHHDLSSSLLLRVQNIHLALRDVMSLSLEASIENFQRDLIPEIEIESWERIVSAVGKTLDELKTNKIDVKRHVVHIALRLSMGDHESLFKRSESNAIEESVVMASHMRG